MARTPDGKGEERVSWQVRIPAALRDKVKALARYEGCTEQDAATRILELFFEGLEIPERKSILYWPDKKKRRL